MSHEYYSHVSINLANNTLCAGDVVRGEAICHFISCKEVRKIRIRLQGDEHTSWTGTESYYDWTDKKTKTRTVYYSADRGIILRDHIVHGEGTVSTGDHIFPFEFALPEDLPGSFQHSYGRISYSVSLTVDRPWKLDYESEHVITIISPIKLDRLSSSYQEPVELSDDKTICCFCCASGPIQLDVNLEKRAFVVGESANVKVYCSNLSNVNVDSITAEMKMKYTFKATHPSTDYRYDSELVTASHNSGVGAHGEKTLNLLTIPQTTVVPNFNGCNLFSSETRLKVTAVVAGCHTDLDVSTSVVLGHVPYSQINSFTAVQDQNPPPYPVNELRPMPMPMPMPVPMPMPMPLPSYEEEAGKTVGMVPPYPVPSYYPGPSVPQQIGAPFAPKSLQPDDTDTGKSSGYEPPPPTYDEASKNFL